MAVFKFQKDEDNTFLTAGLYLGAIAPNPVNCKSITKIIGRKADHEIIDDISREISEMIIINTPIKFDRDYKAKAIYGIVRDIVLKP